MRKYLLIALGLLLVPVAIIVVVTTSGGSRHVTPPGCTPPTPIHEERTLVAIGTLNWRGASHYRKNPHPGERSYTARLPHMIRALDSSGASIVGFQEFETPQAHAFHAQAGTTWGLVSSRKGHRVGYDDAIAYRRTRWRVAAVRYVRIPYFNSEIDSIPLVRFTSRTGAGSVWVLNTHNPANVGGDQARNRAIAVRREARALAHLDRTYPRARIVMTGDMNDRREFKSAMTHALARARQRGWSFANPNSRGIDWILGNANVAFARTVVDKATNDNAHSYTDHPFVHTVARTGRERPGSPRCSISATTGNPTP